MISNPQEFLRTLRDQLSLLSFAQQLAFGAMCCDRHLPDYISFTSEQNWGDTLSLKKALQIAWEMIADERNQSSANLVPLLAACIDATPDTGDFDTVTADYAQDAAIMVCHILQFMSNAAPEGIFLAASRARDLIDAKIQFERNLDPTDPGLENKIASDSLMQEELHALTMMLAAVEASERRLDLVQLRSRAW